MKLDIKFYVQMAFIFVISFLNFGCYRWVEIIRIANMFKRKESQSPEQLNPSAIFNANHLKSN